MIKTQNVNVFFSPEGSQLKKVKNSILEHPPKAFLESSIPWLLWKKYE
jgi:hypothetical protein